MGPTHWSLTSYKNYLVYLFSSCLPMPKAVENKKIHDKTNTNHPPSSLLTFSSFLPVIPSK